MAKDEVIAVCRKHWTAYIKPGLIAFFSLLVCIGSLFDEEVPYGVTIFLLIVSLLAAFHIWLDYKTTYIVLKKTSLIGHIDGNTRITPLTKIQDISLIPETWAVLIGCYTITISNAGTAGTEYVYKRMAKARQFVALVNRQIAAIQ